MILPALFTVLFLFSLFAGPAAYADEAHDWLAKMERASRTVSYEGVFVYQHGDTLESMRVIHSTKDGSVRERLVALNGAAREVVRTERGVQCYFPDDQSVALQRPVGAKGFPTIVPQRLADLDKNYAIRLGQVERVADRPAQLVIIEPKDAYRYGYRLWADQATGLLLKANLVATDHKLIEKFMFTHIRSGIAIPPADLQPKSQGKERVAQPEDSQPVPVQDTGWSVPGLPPGFTLSAHLQQKMGSHRHSVEHFVYSDGLAAVSVFIERVENEAKALHGPAGGMGAVHAFGKVVDNHQVTVVGEVPAVTANMIGQSVIYKDH
jgi:sigma-E factor negative regulatory protein RseB